jgi:hypothetical protein
MAKLYELLESLMATGFLPLSSSPSLNLTNAAPDEIHSLGMGIFSYRMLLDELHFNTQII